MARATFEKNWKNKLLFVVHNRMDAARFNLAADWRAAPRSPGSAGVARNAMSDLALPKLGTGDF